MSSIIFGYTMSLATAATPSTGFLVAYDSDGIIKQKDSNGVITPIGGGPTAGFSSTFSFAQTLAVSNDSHTYSVIMGTATQIEMGSQSSIVSKYGLSSLHLDYNSATSSVYLTTGYNYLWLTNATMSLINTQGRQINISNNSNYFRLESNFGEIFSTREIRLRVFNTSDEILLRSNASATVSSANLTSNAIFIGSQNSSFAPAIINSVIIGGVGQTALVSNSVYIPDVYIQNTKRIRGTLGNASIRFDDSNSLILENNSSLLGIVSSTNSTTFTTNGIIISDCSTSVASPNIDSSPVFISTKDSIISTGVKNAAIIGGINLVNSVTNSVVLGQYVNINNQYTLPDIDGSQNQVLATDGLGNVTWSTQTISATNGVIEFNTGEYGLGGTLSQNTLIDGNNYDLTIGNLDLLSFTASNGIVLQTEGISPGSENRLQVYQSNVLMKSVDDTGSTFSQISTTINESLIYIESNSLYSQLRLNNNAQIIGDLSSDNYMLIRDDLGNKGLVYESDYSLNFTTYSLVTKGYVDGVVDAIGATNGLSELSNGIIGLGGTISQNTLINGSGFTFSFTNFNELRFTASQTNTTVSDLLLRDGFQLRMYDPNGLQSNYIGSVNLNAISMENMDSSGSYSVLQADISGVSMYINDGASQSDIRIYNTDWTIGIGDGSSDNRMVITDEFAAKGLVYFDDYSPNFTTYSLVTKAYVDSISTSKYSITMSFTASVTETINHNLGTDEIIVQAYDSSGIMVIPGNVQINGLNDVDITFSRTLSNIKIIVVG